MAFAFIVVVVDFIVVVTVVVVGFSFWLLKALFEGPKGVCVEGQSIMNTLLLLCLGFRCGWVGGGSACERADGRQFVL